MPRTAEARHSETVVAGDSLIGVGLYTAAEAARLIDVPARRVHRWLAGYEFRSGGKPRHSPPLWQPQVPRIENTLGLAFLDLMELRFVNLFLSHGVSLHAIRLALVRAREAFERDHPFATRRLQTDGHTIFLEVSGRLEEPRLLDLVRSQYVFRRMVAPTFRDIDFEADTAARWWPLSRQRSVVLDPQRAFGQPIAVRSGVPTAALAAPVRSEGSIDAAARWFETDVQSVRDAVEFERKLAA